DGGDTQVATQSVGFCRHQLLPDPWRLPITDRLGSGHGAVELVSHIFGIAGLAKRYIFQPGSLVSYWSAPVIQRLLNPAWDISALSVADPCCSDCAAVISFYAAGR